MQSTLIRFTKREYAEEFINGKIYMSSLSTFWDIRNSFEEQKDVFEGVAAIVPKEDVPIPDELSSVCADYVRYRVDAYKYLNLVCFFRVDFDENTRWIQLPTIHMKQFGDSVIIIKNENEFINRVLKAVKLRGGACITGDVRYHKVEDKRLYTDNSMTLITSCTPDSKSSFLPFEKIPSSNICVQSYGCLDKYDKYSMQKEWRICYLDQEHNQMAKTIDIGDISDIAVVISADNIAEYFLSKYKFCIPNYISEKRTHSKGTMKYSDFKKLVESIDGNCRLIIDIV